MPIIAFVNPKGGSSKSTAALVMATTLAKNGVRVAALDCDPNAPLLRWADGESAVPVNIVAANSDDIIDRIEEAEAAYDWVLIDTEGTANMLVSTILLRTDLVIIPISMSSLDADMAGRAIRLVTAQSRAQRRTLPFKVLFTRTSPAIMTRVERKIVNEIKAAGVSVFQERLHTRQAYISMFEEKLSLWEMDMNRISGVEKAIINAKAVTSEMVRTIAEILKGDDAEEEQPIEHKQMKELNV